MGEWKKRNLVGLVDKKGQYDLWKCDGCGIEYKRRSLAWNPPVCKCNPRPEVEKP